MWPQTNDWHKCGRLNICQLIPTRESPGIWPSPVAFNNFTTLANRLNNHYLNFWNLNLKMLLNLKHFKHWYYMHTNPPKNSHSQNISIQKIKIIMCLRCTWNRLIISPLGLTTKIFHYMHECIPKSKKIQNTRLNFLRSSYMSTIFTSCLPFTLPFPTWFPDSQIHDRFSYSCDSPYCVDPWVQAVLLLCTCV